MKLTTKKLTQIIREELENTVKEAGYRGMRRGREDDEYIGDKDGRKELVWNAKRRLQNNIREFVWGEEGIVGQVAQWMAAEAGTELPAGYENPTQIARTEFGKAVLADESLQQMLRSAIGNRMDLSALNRAVAQIPGLDEVEEYIDLEELGEDAGAFVAMDILRYLHMKLA